jgi:dihydrofolate reductase
MKSAPEVKLSKLIMWNLISLDGFFEGTEPWSLDWFQSLFDDELQQHVLEQLHAAAALVFGRATYEGMAAYWPSASGEIADLMNRLPKVVFSRTLDRGEWQNASLVKSGVGPEIRRLKSLDQGQIYVFGSADLSATLMREGLFDEYRICIVPVVLGNGKPLFGRSTGRRKLKLLEARPLASGCVILRYTPM